MKKKGVPLPFVKSITRGRKAHYRPFKGLVRLMYICSDRGIKKARNALHFGQSARAFMNLTMQIYKNYFVPHVLLIIFSLFSS